MFVYSKFLRKSPFENVLESGVTATLVYAYCSFSVF